MSPQATHQPPRAPTPVVAPSLGQIGIDLEALAIARQQARYDQLLAAAQTTVRPRRDTDFDSRPIGQKEINSRPSVYMTVSDNNKPIPTKAAKAPKILVK